MTPEKTFYSLNDDFPLPILYQELRTRVEARGSEKMHTIFRCKPFFEGEPWYDFVRVSVKETRDGVESEHMYAAQILAFVDLGEHGMHAFVKYFISALAYNEREFPNYQYHDLAQHNKYLRIPLVHEDPNEMARFGIIDTEQIEDGLWVQADFETPDRFWVLMNT